MKPTRATLLKDPYENRDGEFVAPAVVSLPSKGVKWETAMVKFFAEPDAREGDTINVERGGGEWRVV